MKIIQFKSRNVDNQEREWAFSNISTLEAEWLSDECDLPANDDSIYDVKVGVHTVCVETFGELLEYLGVISNEV